MCDDSCSTAQWRRHPDNYLREVLTAKVYDVAVTTPLTKAVRLRWGAAFLPRHNIVCCSGLLLVGTMHLPVNQLHAALCGPGGVQ